MKRIAIIGSGISGLYAAYLLHKEYDITIYEKEQYLGGHTRTLSVEYKNGVNIDVDTGFIVFNEQNYPNFTKMLNTLNVRYGNSDMSFAVTSSMHKDPEIKYSDINSFFADKKTIFSYKRYNLLYNINKFNYLSKKTLKNINNDIGNITLHKFLKDNNFNDFFIDNYVLPMGSSIWSCKPSQILQFPYLSYVRFMNNHGLLSINNQPQWHYIKNGSKTYVNSLIEYIDTDNRVNSEVKEVIKSNNGVKIITDDSNDRYDYVFFCNHPNEVTSIGKNLSNHQIDVLKDIKYSKNEVVLHKDPSIMPRNPKCWASWVYKKTKNNHPILSYWMNSLQDIDKKHPIFVSLNPEEQIKEDKIFNKHILEHPLFDMTARNAQNLMPLIQGKNNSFFCGAYNKYGFHEDGVVSSIKAVEKLKSIDL